MEGRPGCSTGRIPTSWSTQSVPTTYFKSFRGDVDAAPAGHAGAKAKAKPKATTQAMTGGARLDATMTLRPKQRLLCSED
eukprot:2702923-Amphidinium_carterae.5